jgi:hypothetical protein
MNSSSISSTDVLNEDNLEIYKGIEFELGKLLDLVKTKKEAEKHNYSDPAVSY